MLCFGMPTLIETPDARSAAALCARLGLRFIEINMSFPQYQPEKLDVSELRDIEDSFGIFYTVHIDESLDPCSVNPGIAAVYTETMLKTVALARALEIPALNMHMQRGIYVTLPDRRTYIYAENEGFYLDMLRRFRDAVTDAVGDSGVKVCVENTDGYLPFQLRGVDTLLESPVFMLTYDIGHDYAVQFADRRAILDRGDRLRHMHMHDAVGESVHKALGDGEIDLPFYLALAKEHRCRVVLETKTAAALERSVQWLRARGEL